MPFLGSDKNYIKLDINLRNSEHVYNVSCALGLVRPNVKNEMDRRYLRPAKTISGPLNYHYHNIDGWDWALLAEAVIRKYFVEHPKEPIVMIFDNMDLNDFCRRLEGLVSDMNYEIHIIDEQFDLERVKQNIKMGRGIILLTEILTFNGAQARNTIIFQTNDDFDRQPKLRNLILRTQSFTIVIHDTGGFRKVPGLIKDSDLQNWIRSSQSAET